MAVSWLFVFVLSLTAFAVQGKDELEGFLSAFPKANITDIYDIPKTLFVNDYTPDTLTFNLTACATIPLPADTDDVNNLRPGNIRVIMGMGDSITAAMSAKDTSVLSMKEYRGICYSMGADTGISTFPNILKPYVASDAPIGASTGIGARTSVGNGLNGAVSGAINSDMLGQAQWLFTALNDNTEIDIDADWKVLTIWIGSNNLCDVCDDEANNNGDNFETSVTSALDYLYENVPRLFVNLVANLDISTLYEINSGACGVLHNIACPCVGSSVAANRAKVSVTAKDYVDRAHAIAENFNARNKTDFAVVVQPFLVNNIITDRSMLSAADCFHPSATAHAIAAVALWNNMLTPANEKKTSWSATDVPICPTETSIFPTY